jgi:diadenosine tetraphosphate (Ap4A) HIT family hydrolase
MPRLIPRAEALDRIRREGGEPECLMCAILDRRVGPVHVVYEDEAMLVMLPRYVRRWGHAMVVLKAHVTSYTEVELAVWLEANRLALVTARVIEHVQRPRRCYVASTGSSAGAELTQTSRHLHVHVIPLYEPDDKPADIFSWSEGVYVGEPEEWEALAASYRAVWAAFESGAAPGGCGQTSAGGVGS